MAGRERGGLWDWTHLRGTCFVQATVGPGKKKPCLQWTHASPQLYPCPPRQGRKKRREIKLGSRTQTRSLSDRLHADPSEVQATFSRNRRQHRGHGLCQPSRDVGFAQSERGKDLPNRGTGRSKGGEIWKFMACSRNSKTSAINPRSLRSKSYHRFSPWDGTCITPVRSHWL